MCRTGLYWLIFILFATECWGWRSFFRGRESGGNLGEPSKYPNLEKAELPKDQWFEQILDHFDPRNNTTWKQRYFMNNNYYKPGGPAFLLIGGEGTASPKWMEQGSWIKYAKELNAICFQLEHRYYGISHPTSDLATKNLLYLSSEQALADLAVFIDSMNTQHNLTESKWIAFGGSYPGSLAAWLRAKYPHLVHGSISSSGPLLAKIDFTEYYDVVVQSLSTYSDNCVEAVQKSFQEVEVLLKHMIGMRDLNDKFKLCDPVENSINNTLDISNLFENLASNFADVVQYNKDNRPGNNVTIDDLCDIMTNTTIGPPINRLAEVNTVLLKKNKEKCLDYKYTNMINEMRETQWSANMSEGGRQWVYQTCTEFGFYQTSVNKSSVFGDRFNADFFIQQCSDIYSNRFNKESLERSIKMTNLYYGALDPETTNVLYVHGSIDPWHALGLTESKNPNTPVIYIEGTAHCANMYEPSDKDPPQLVEARKKIQAYIVNLLKI